MSWLVSLVFAGMMLTSQSGLPDQTNSNYTEINKTQIVRLDETERFEQTYPLNANGKVSVSNINGSITIEAWDRNEVKLVAVKTADTREHLQDVQIQIESRPDSLSIETDLDGLRRRGNDSTRYGKLEVTYQLTVPRTAVLNEIEAVNGSVTVSNMTNFTKISAVNGGVKASNLRGTADLSTVNGVVEADFSSLQTGSQISLSTVNGRANLLIPSDANVTIKADSVNGNIVNDFGLPIRKGQYVGRNLYGKVGSGDVKIKLESVNGELAVRRKQDGKNVNPATNLLNQLTDEDKNSDSDVWAKSKNKAKVGKAMPTVIAPGNVYVTVPEISVDVQKEMEKAQREMAKAKIKINTDEMNAQIKRAMKDQEVALARMGEYTWIAGAPSIEKKSDNFPVKGVPKVTVEAKNCSVYVRGWDKSEVQYSVTRFSRAVNSPALNIQVDHTDSQVHITVPENSGSSVNGSFPAVNSTRMRIEVFVPKKSNLRIHTEGEIRLENVSGNLDIEGGDESVNVRDSDGLLKIATAEGRIRVIGFDGTIDATSVDGMMNLEGNFKDFNAATTDGTIILSLPENTNAIIRAENDLDIQGEGLNLIRKDEESNVWRIGGGGGKTYRFVAGDGKVIIRNSNQMATVWQ